MILVLVSPRQRGLDLAQVFGADAERCVILTGGPVPAGSELAVELTAVEEYTTEALLAAGRELARRHCVTRVVGLAEADVIAAAVLREELGLPGQRPASAVAYRDKALMREYTKAAGLVTPSFRRVGTASEVRAAVAEHGLPMVLKPRRASGSVGVRILDEESDVRALPSELPDHIVESFVPGEVVHVDGLVVAGQPVLALPAVYSELGCLAHLADAGGGSQLLPFGHPWFKPLVTELWRVVEALPIASDLLLHAEFFIADGQRPVLCEIASRLAGHPIPPMIDRALQTDLRAAWMRIQAGLEVSVSELAAAAADAPLVANYGLPPRRGELACLPSSVPVEAGDWLHDLAVLAVPGERWDEQRYAARKSGDFIVTWTVTATDAHTLADRVEESAKLLEAQVQWV